MGEILLRVAGGVFAGVLPVAADVAQDTTTGIVIFAVGIVIGLTCVLIMDLIVRRRIRRDYKAWLAAGSPERRIGERRGLRARALGRQD